MNLVSALFVASFGLGALAQSPYPPRQVTVERLCGKLKHVEEFQITATSSGQKSWNLPHVIVNLYPAPENGECCERAIATAETGLWGSFKLKTKQLQGGLYWLEVLPNGRKYRILVRYAPKRRSDQECYNTWWQVNDAGDFSEGIATTVTVD